MALKKETRQAEDVTARRSSTLSFQLTAGKLNFHFLLFFNLRCRGHFSRTMPTKEHSSSSFAPRSATFAHASTSPSLVKPPAANTLKYHEKSAAR